MSEFDLDDLDSALKEEYKKSSKDKKIAMGIVKYKHFIDRDFRKKLKNSYLLKNFCIEAHIKLNKNPKANNLPQLDLDLVFGGEFEKGSSKVAETKGQTFALQFQQQQLIAVLKFLEYSGYYTKYQAFVLKPFYENELSKEDVESYIDLYVDYRRYKNDTKNKASKEKVDKLTEHLKAVEKDYEYEKIAAVRNVAFNKHIFEKRKEEERSKIDQKGK